MPSHRHSVASQASRPRDALAGEAGNVLVLRRKRDDRIPILTVDGPFRVESDDLADPVVDAVVAPRWVVQLSIPAGRTKGDEKLALRLARHFAEAFGGGVYDPQQDAVVWPRRRRQYRPAAAEERIRLVNVEWFVPPSRAQALPEKWLELAGSLLKEALPRRYGTFEPLQHRIDESGLEGFSTFWREQGESPYGGDFFWTATPPCFGGSAFFPDPREPGPRWASAAARYIGLSADFDGRALERDEPWREAVAALFLELAAGVGAFYAAGYVKRNVIAKRGQIWHDQDTESLHLSRRWWEGLPPHPTWLAWFGDPYRSMVESAVRDHVTEERPEGLLHRLGRHRWTAIS
jgi:hypothetical protein